MNTDFVAVIVQIVLWLPELFAVLSGLGLLVRRVLGLPIYGVMTWLLCFWSGWVCAILILQCWHLWLKIDGRAFALIVILARFCIILRYDRDTDSARWECETTIEQRGHH